MKMIDNKENIYKRICMTIGGIFLCGVSIGFLKLASFGIDPFQSFMAGLNAFVPISFGMLHITVSICLILFILFSDRHYIGLGTIFNLFLLGYIVEYSSYFLQKTFTNPSFGIRILSFFIGIGLICISSSFYFTADMGVSPYDAVALILSNKWHVGKFRYVRVCTDMVCVTLGCALYILSGGSFFALPSIAGLGTLLTAFFMGTLIDFFTRTLAQPFLNG